MPTSDLPVELWLEILAYLPRTTLHKMIGVNRTLFELALNDMYEEVRLISDDKQMIKTLKQLHHQGISGRVRRLFIRPAFLPGITENVDFEFRSRFHRRVASSIRSLGNLVKSPKSIPEETPEILPDSVYAILNVAKKAVKHCGNLKEITVVVHDHALIPPFMSFLSSLWASDSIGPNLRKLTIDTTVSKIPFLLKPLDRFSSVLTNLDEFRLDLSISRRNHSSSEWWSAGQALVSFFKTFKGTITSFSFSSLVMDNLGELFEMLPRLPKLKKLEVLAIVNSTSLPKPEGFTGFIAKHAPTLKTLVVKPHSRHVSFHHSNDEYTFWLNNAISSKSKDLYSFANLNLSNLRCLDVELRDMNPYHDRLNGDLNAPSLLPPLSQVAPNLTRLVMTGTMLSLHRLTDIVDKLSRRGEATNVLEELSFTCSCLTVQHFDFLAKKLPLLKALTVQYENVSGPTTMNRYSMPTFDNVMHGRTYPSWRLRYLRLASVSACGQGHPRLDDMKILAASLSDRVVLDNEYACHCRR
ncbi:hypothetical protein CPB84DRAFT_1844186 [Gymnopilus junonius]|uniref:F-box domain-containing protein n=1 Tax=Gymnopilus junonius TaxID=109634 RepID=A0A9P5TS80_GYMJU|nr:hypothetical protein CPB84DRAFT_1844186 [Gymnopilus junonius]